jgi:transcriptional regulator with XRE-family HTH domain
MAVKTASKSRPLWASRLAKARAAAGYTQTELGRLVVMSQQTITGYERGEREPTLEMFQRLAKALRVSPAWLTHGIENAG